MYSCIVLGGRKPLNRFGFLSRPYQTVHCTPCMMPITPCHPGYPTDVKEVMRRYWIEPKIQELIFLTSGVYRHRKKQRPASPARRTGRAVTVSGRNVTARAMILAAYHLSEQQVLGGPDWVDSMRYDIEGKAASPTTDEGMHKMLQQLLAERFHLEASHLSKEMAVYTLKVSSHGSRLLEIKEGERLPSIVHSGREGVPIIGQIEVRGPLERLADRLSKDSSLGRPVLNGTGLTGNYLVYLIRYADEDIAAAVETQLGLKLESQKASLPTIVINHIEKPTAN